jgi:formylmethanofuran dehydrogenase subunit E
MSKGVAGSTRDLIPSTQRNQIDNSPDWYYPEWLATAPHAPVFRVRDTVNKYGRYARDTKTITLKDLIKYHGHFCGGLVEGATALRVAFDRLFPEGIIDRTDLRIASNNSACGADVADYLSGARTRFGSHLLDRTLGASEYVVKRLSTGASVRVLINQQTYPVAVRALMKTIESGDYEPADIDRFQDLQWQCARVLVSQPAVDSVDIRNAATYQWPKPPCGDLGRRTDNDYKNVPEAQPETR